MYMLAYVSRCMYMHVYVWSMYRCTHALVHVCGIHIYASHICKYAYTTQHTEAMGNKERSRHSNGWVATISRLLKIISLFSRRDLQKRRYSAKETYNFKEPTNRSHPIPSEHSQRQCQVKYKIKSKTKWSQRQSPVNDKVTPERQRQTHSASQRQTHSTSQGWNSNQRQTHSTEFKPKTNSLHSPESKTNSLC